MIGGDGEREKKEKSGPGWSGFDMAGCPGTPRRPHFLPTYGLDLRFADSSDIRG